MSTQKRGKTYYSRLRVPSSLRLILQKREIVRSLRTSSYSEAITLSCILEGRILNFPRNSGHEESDEYNHFWRCSNGRET